MQNGLYEVDVLRFKQIYDFRVVLFCMLFAAAASAQDIRNMDVIEGIKAFYMADFEGARRILQNALINDRLEDDDLFAAHVYIAFSYMREEIQPETARLHIVRAITSAPQVELDQEKIPPDLYEQYMQVRESLVGTIFVETDPDSAAVLLLEPTKGLVMNRTSPVVFGNLLQGNYQIVLSKDKYASKTVDVQLSPGAQDTVSAVLLEKRTSFFKKYWYVGAGAVATTALIYAVTRGGDDGSSNPPTPIDDLPGPPDRP